VFGLVVMTKIIDTGFKDRAVGMQEIQQYDKYVTDLIVLNKEVGPRRMLAQYFANVTVSETLRQRWKDYYHTVDSEYQHYLRQDSIFKSKLAIEQAKDSVKTSKKERTNIQILQQRINELNRQLNSSIKTPANATVLVSKIIVSFHTVHDDKDSDTGIHITVQSYDNGNYRVIGESFMTEKRKFQMGTVNYIDVPIIGTVSKNDISSGIFHIEISPKNNDDWKFVPQITFVLSDGTAVQHANYGDAMLSFDHRGAFLNF